MVLRTPRSTRTDAHLPDETLFRALDVAEKRIQKDGRISVGMCIEALAVRVSTLPSRGVERVVLRILDKDQGALPLAELGMQPSVLSAFHKALATPNGIVLVTGPTGSGKTTTPYAGQIGRAHV